MNRKIALSLALLAAVSAGAFFALERPGQAQTEKQAPAKAGSAGPQAGGQIVSVEAMRPKTGRIERVVEAIGNLVSNESVVLSPEITGRITELVFEEGQSVKKGDVLVRLDDAIARAELTQMETSLTLSTRNFERASRLFEQDAESGSTRDEALAKRNTDKAGVELAKARLDKTVIRAPFDGVVGLRKVSVGDFVNPGEDMVNVEGIDPLKVDFRMPELYLGALKQGQAIEVQVDAFPEQLFLGEVYAIDPLVDSAGRTVVLRARLPNPDLKLRPGLFARVTLTLGENENALLLPEEALVPQGNQQFVYKVEGDQPVLTKVETGVRRKGEVEILQGIGNDDMIITAGQMKIRPNTKVKILEQKDAGPESEIQ